MKGIRIALGAVSSGLLIFSLPFVTGNQLCAQAAPVSGARAGITANRTEVLAQDDSNSPQYAAPQGDDNGSPDSPDQPNAQPGDAGEGNSDSPQMNSPGSDDSSQMNAGQDQNNDNPDQSNGDSDDSQNEPGSSDSP